MTTEDGFIDNGFALDSYLVVRHGPLSGAKGGTMSKAVNAPGGLADELSRSADKAPGPGFYFKEGRQKLFSAGARGGTFSKLTRDWAMGKKASTKTPSVGQYSTINEHVTPRTKGGLMSKNDRVCAFAKMAERAAIWNTKGPGSYDGVVPEKHKGAPVFAPPRTESRSPRKPTPVGPGYYNPNYNQLDKNAPAYSGGKEEIGTFMARMNKDKHSIPFPWYKELPDARSKVHDRQGTHKHCKKLLGDRKVSPRKRPSAVSRQYEVTSPTAIELDNS
jgi:hypothetical protein